MTNLSKKISTLMLITALLLSNVTMVFADTDDISNYRQLEYIESTGTQYINTGVNVGQYNNTIIIDADMAFTSVPTGSSNQSYLFGTAYYNSTTNRRQYLYVGYRGDTSTSLFTYNFGLGGGSSAVTLSDAVLDTNIHNFVINKASASIQYVNYKFDEYTRSVTGSISLSLEKPLLIFCGRNGTTSGEPAAYYSNARLYSFKIYDGETLLRNYVPVERLSDSSVGLYDLVNNQFYGNNGSGSFIAGYQTTYNITATAAPPGSGSVTGSGYYTYGQTCTLTATPNTGYQFSGWSDGTNTNPKSFAVTNSLNITANFTSITQNYTVTVTVSPLGSGTVTGSGTYERGDTVELVATPATGYVFKQWSDGVFYDTRYFTIQNDVNLTAYFEEEQSEYEVTLSVYPENSGTVEGDGTYEAGQTIQISAEAEEGYEFVSWSDGSIANPRSITVNQTIDLTANFRAIEPEPEFDQDNIILIVLLLSFMVIYFIGRGEIYNG